MRKLHLLTKEPQSILIPREKQTNIKKCQFRSEKASDMNPLILQIKNRGQQSLTVLGLLSVPGSSPFTLVEACRQSSRELRPFKWSNFSYGILALNC